MPDPIQASSSSDPEFVANLTEHQEILHAFLISLLPGSSEVDDILQRTNLVLWEKRAQFERGTSFKSWALSVAYWEARAWMSERKRGDWLVVDDTLAQKLTQHIEVQPAHPANASVPALRVCLAKLRDLDRLLVLSHHQHEKSLAECGRIFDRSPESLSVSLVRIRAALRRCIKSLLAVKEAIISEDHLQGRRKRQLRWSLLATAAVLVLAGVLLRMILVPEPESTLIFRPSPGSVLDVSHTLTGDDAPVPGTLAVGSRAVLT